MEKWALTLVAKFALKQIQKFQTGINWDKVEADLEARIKTLIPVPMLDDGVNYLLKLAIRALKAALSDQNAMQQLVSLLIAEKWAEALAFVEKIIWSNKAVVAALDNKDFAAMA